MARTLVNEVKDSQRNYLINSLMEIRQRYGGSISGAITASQTYKVHDRWITYYNNAGFFSSAAQGPTVITDPTTGFTIDALNFNANASNASAEGYVVQRIEARHARELVGKKVSISFLLRNNNFTTVRVRLYYANALNNFTGGQTQFHLTSSQVLTANSTVKEVKFEDMVTVPVNAQNGIAVEIIYSGFSVGVTDDTAISKIMLNEGSVAATFRTFGDSMEEEISLCQRYFCKSYDLFTGPGTVTQSNANQFGAGSTTHRDSWVNTPRMRVIPAMTIYSPKTGGSGLIHDRSSDVDLGVSFGDTGENRHNLSFTAVEGRHYSYHWTADAEL